MIMVMESPMKNDSSLEWFDTFPYVDGIWNEVGADGILGQKMMRF